MNLPKIIPLAILNFLLILAFAISSSSISQNIDIILNTKKYLTGFVFFIALITLFLSILAILEAVIADKKIHIALNIFFLLGFIIGNLQHSKTESLQLTFLSYLLVLLGFISAQQRFQSTYSNLIKPKLGESAKASFKLFFMLMAIALSLNFYSLNRQITVDQIISNKMIDTIVDFSISTIGGGAEKLSVQIKPIIAKQIIGLTKPYEIYLPLIFAVPFYFLISFAFSISKILLGQTVNMITWMGIKSGYLQKNTETIEITRISV